MRFHEILNEKRVLSSWIADLSYQNDEDDEPGVMMTLLNGREYFHSGIPVKTYNQWIRAGSKGKFWHRFIKGVY